MMISGDRYNEKYFKSLNYTDYLSRTPRYFGLAKEITFLLSQLGIINHSSKIMDYGCAVGFLMEGLISLKYECVYGHDISAWAVEQAKEKQLTVFDSFNHSHYDVMFCLDIFEHMTDKQIKELFSFYDASALVVRIPVSTNGGKTFHLDVSNTDDTHINCKNSDDWIELLTKHGYDTFLPLNLYTIYNSDGVVCFIALKNGVKYL